MGGKGGGGEGMPGMTGDNTQNIGVLDQAINSVGSTAGPNAAMQWMMSGGGAGAATAAANAPAPATPAPAAAAPAQLNLGATDEADPATPKGTDSQTNQEQDTGAALAQAVPQMWQDEMKKKPQPVEGSMDITGQV